MDSDLKVLITALKGLGEFRSYEKRDYIVNGQGAHEWFVRNVPEDGASYISYSSLSPAKDITWERFFVPKYMTYSDYSGSTVERANCESFLEDHKEVAGVYEVSGGYGTKGVAILLSAITEEMIEVFQCLSDYPLMDDEHHSELEMKLEAEDWDSWIRGDFKRALEKAFPEKEEVLDEMDEGDHLQSLYHSIKERTNTYWHAESAVGGHVDIERLVAGVVESDLVIVPPPSPATVEFAKTYTTPELMELTEELRQEGE